MWYSAFSPRLFVIALVFGCYTLSGQSPTASHQPDPTDTCSIVMHTIEPGLFRSVPITQGFDSAFQFMRTLPGLNQKMDVQFSTEGYRTMRFIAQQAWLDSFLLLDDKSFIALSYTADSLGKKHLNHVEANYCFIHPEAGAAVFAKILNTLNGLNLPFTYRTNAKHEKYRLYSLGCNRRLTLRYGTDMNNEYSVIELRIDREFP